MYVTLVKQNDYVECLNITKAPGEAGPAEPAVTQK